jgi:16S rRNA (guanine966-N2)-methyltransferase
MTRIIGGTLRGRRLAVPAGTTTRPTSDRAREGLFSALAASRGSIGRGAGGLAGVRFLDLYAGSGGIGLEALSRGATAARMIEKNPRAAATARANATALGAVDADRAVVSTMSAEAFARQPCSEPPYDIAFLDPPYSTPASRVCEVLSGLVAHGWLAPDALVVVERSSHDGDWRWPEGFVQDRSRRYGDATLWYGHAAGEPSDLRAEE